jgi:hypothetical protein
LHVLNDTVHGCFNFKVSNSSLVDHRLRWLLRRCLRLKLNGLNFRLILRWCLRRKLN